MMYILPSVEEGVSVVISAMSWGLRLAVVLVDVVAHFTSCVPSVVTAYF